MKKRIVVFIAALMALMFTLGFSALTVSAEESGPSVSIEKFNLAFENDTHLKYAVKFTGIDDSEINYNNIGMLYWTDYDGGFTPGTENYSTKTTGYTTIDGQKYYAFEYDNLAAKQLTDYVYSIAYLEYGGETYYSELVKYSALEYAYNRLGKTDEGTTDTELITILNNMLTYGASAQEYFDYKEDRLATKDFYQLTLVGGTLDDGFTSGLYLSTDEVTITAPAELDGKAFSAWQNSVGETVSTYNPSIITNFTANETYTATYTETKNYSEGLEYTLNDDGESYSVTGIGTCTDTEIIIPNTYEGKPVTSIGINAFCNCRALASIYIPEGVNKIQTNEYIGSPFLGCWALETIEVADANTAYQSIDGSLYTKDGKTLIQYAIGKTDTSFTIPDSVTSIGDEAFRDCTSLTSVEIPNGVTRIGWHAFCNCRALTSIKIPNGVTSICRFAFYGCSALTSIEIADSVTSIDASAFDSCTSLTSIVIPDSVKIIGSYAFYGCRALTSIVIPDSVTSIDDSAFAYCSSLTSIVIPDSVTSIGNDAFFGCSALTSIVISDSVTSIDASAFAYCTSLTSIEISDSVTNIGIRVFYGCSALTSIVISDSVTSISYESFENCSSLKDVYYMGTELEWETISIESNNDPVTNATRYYYSGTAPTTVGNFWHYVNGVPTDWSEYIAPTDREDLEFTSNGDGTCYISGIGTCADTVIVIPPVSPDGDIVTSVGNDAFRRCTSLTNVSIPSSVTGIGNYAFYKCESLSSIEIPDGVTSIGDYAFSGCTSLTNVSIFSSVTNIGSSAFSGCSSLSDVYIKDVEAWLNSSFCGSGLSAHLKYDVALHILDENGNEVTELVIPDSITSIGSYAFRNAKNLTSVTIPDSVTSIGDYAFALCSSLENVVLSENIKSINKTIFAGCVNLRFNNYKDGFYLGTDENQYYALIKISDSTITDFELHSNAKIIADYAAEGCYEIQSLVFSSRTLYVGKYVFNDCNITDIYYTGTYTPTVNIDVGNDCLSNAEVHFG